jgi:hypothetical protein
VSAINFKNKPLPSVPDGMPVVSTTVEVVGSILPRVGLVACNVSVQYVVESRANCLVGADLPRSASPLSFWPLRRAGARLSELFFAAEQMNSSACAEFCRQCTQF